MQIQQNIDPRDDLAKIRRKPLENFFKSHFAERWKAGMPAEVMRMLLRQEGIHQIPNARLHRIGEAPPGPIKPPAPTQKEVEAAEDVNETLKRQWEEQNKFTEDMDIRVLRKACKERHIKLARTDKRIDMVRKLNGTI